MFYMLNRQTLAWALDVLGFAILLLACAVHSWTLDGVGIAVLVIAAFIDPPEQFASAVRSFWGNLKAAILGALLTNTPLNSSRVEVQYAFNFGAGPGYPLRCEWAVTPEGRPTNIRAWGDCH